MSEWSALSRLVDGEATAGEAAALCAAWRQSEPLRGRWHEWHLIGDVMRSEELSGAPQRDEAMLKALRERLALEPVPLAPAAWRWQGLATKPLAQRWLAPVAAAAGVVAVAGVLVMAQLGLPEPSPASGVQALAPAALAPVTQTALPQPAPQFSPGPSQRLALQDLPSAAARPVAATSSAPVWMLRDVGLDRYVSAHRKMPLGAEMPGRADPLVQLVRVEK